MPEPLKIQSIQQLFEEALTVLIRNTPDEAKQGDVLRKIVAVKTRRAWERGKKVSAANVERFDLGRDESGAPQYMIAMDVEGKREHHRTVPMPVSDPQSAGFAQAGAPIENEPDVTAILDRIATAKGKELASLVCDAESLRFSGPARGRLSSILWAFIAAHRDSPETHMLTAVGAAIRKYVAMLDANRIGEIGSLLESGHRAPLPLELELELVKMIYRKFEANPPAADSQPELAARLWELAQDYMRPRIILRDKHATVASLSVEAIVAMRSTLAEPAVAAALATPYSWFGEMVRDNLARLSERWRAKDRRAAEWCDKLLGENSGQGTGKLSASNASY